MSVAAALIAWRATGGVRWAGLRPGMRGTTMPCGRGGRQWRTWDREGESLMAERVDKPELVDRVARRLDRDGETVGEIVEGFLEEVYEALKHGDSVSLRGFGSFYVRAEPDSWVFKFNPSQRLRALFGWSSSYHGPL
jgi:DNA-binding protein HU-beta